MSIVDYFFIITSINVVLILTLLYVFLQTYRKVRSEFTLGLIVFALVLLVQITFSCPPLTNLFFGGSLVCENIFYHSIAATFEFFALVILLYLMTR